MIAINDFNCALVVELWDIGLQIISVLDFKLQFIPCVLHWPAVSAYYKQLWKLPVNISSCRLWVAYVDLLPKCLNQWFSNIFMTGGQICH